MQSFAYYVTLLLLAEQFSGRTPIMGQSWHSGGALSVAFLTEIALSMLIGMI